MISLLLIHAIADTYLWGEKSKKTCIRVNKDMKVLGWTDPKNCEDVYKYYFKPYKGCTEARIFPEEKARRLAREALRIAALVPDLPDLTSEMDDELFTPAQYYQYYGNSPTSYKNMLLGNKELRYLYCADKIKEIYQSGESLFDQEIHDAILPLRDLKLRSGVQDFTFFHYFGNRFYPSEDLAFKKVIQEQDFVKIITHLRTYGGSWGHPLYVAEDPFSSSDYGDWVAVLELNPNAQLFQQDNDLMKRAWARILEKFPQLSECGGFRARYGRSSHHELSFVMMEDSGVEVVEYDKNQWFQVLSSEAFVKSKWGEPREIRKEVGY